jgi:HAD superfamily hydrolase (TIGR01509 family)
MPKAIIFDMDGVLFDSQPLHFQAEKETITHFGYPITEEELKGYLGWYEDDFWKDVIGRYNLDTTVDEMKKFEHPIIEALLVKSATPDKELQHILTTLKNKSLKLAVASSAPRKWVDIILGGLSVKDYFDGIVCGEDIQNGKPAPDIFLHAAEIIGSDPSDCIVVEDAPAGIEAANRAGMCSIALRGEVNSALDLSKAKKEIKSLRELL